MIAFLPKNAEGNLRDRILRETANANGVTLNIKEYDRTPEGIEMLLQEAAVEAQSSDTIYVPEGGPIPSLVIGGLRRLGVETGKKQIFGFGAWESIEKGNGYLEGALYPGRDVSLFEAFAERYSGKFGVQPGVQAALAYDAVTLAAELVRMNGTNAFEARNFESARGFQGTTGAFRLRPDGTTDRGLAMYRIKNGEGQLVEPAISGFSSRGF